jgi:hypothetical protein
MTLIVGIRCGDSAVLCADSQETLGDGQKIERNKLHVSRKVAGRFDVVIAGAGNAPLSDALRRRILEGFDKIRVSTPAAVLPVLRDALCRFGDPRISWTVGSPGHRRARADVQVHARQSCPHHI